MVNTNYEKLYGKLCQARETLKLQYWDENKIALVNYMENLNEALYEMDCHEIDEIDIYDGVEDAYRLYCREMSKRENQFVDSVMKHQEFHQNFFGTILKEWKRELPEENVCALNRSVFSQKDFMDILFQFFKEIHLEKEYEKILQEKRIYSVKEGFQSLGFFIYNPITQDSDIFVEGFQYDLEHMNTLVHEIGHYYDFTKPYDSIQDFNQSFYLSCNREVISLLMERVFQRFLLKNHISSEQTVSLIYEFQKLSYDLMGTAYMYSLVDKDFINKKISKEELQTILKTTDHSFIDRKQFVSFLKNLYDYSFSNTFQYVYGDIISLFLADEVEKNGFSNELMDSFFEQRQEPFSLDFLEKNEINAEKCIKMYQKELKFMRK